jgi:1,4-alpha-glucan branching enzyme
VRRDWTIEVKGKKEWKEIFNSNDADFWGTGDVFNPNVRVELISKTTGSYQLTVHLPALGAVVLK